MIALRKIVEHALNLAIPRVSFPRIHTSCIGKQCAYETVEKSGDRGLMSLL